MQHGFVRIGPVFVINGQFRHVAAHLWPQDGETRFHRLSKV